VILVKDADQLFDTLAEKVQAAEDSVRPHPADSATFTAQVKRYIPEDRHRIRLCDLLREEASQTLKRLAKIDAEQLFRGGNFVYEVERREDASEKLLRGLAQYGLHGKGDCGPELRFLIEIIADDHFPSPSQRKDHGLILYPAVVGIYIASVAALSNNRDAITAEVLNARGLLDQQRGKTLDLLARSQLGQHLDQNGVPSDLRLGAFLRERCKPFLRPMFSTEEAFDWTFDRFEYISALAMRTGTDHGHMIPGLWVRNLAWRRLQNRDDLLSTASREIEEQGDNWPYLNADFSCPLYQPHLAGRGVGG
jgi:hypothetical protein